MNEIAQWQLQPLPISGLCYFDNALWIRLDGGEGSVKAAREMLGGEEFAGQFWKQLREQQLPFFSLPGTLLRISLPSDAPMMDLPGEQLIDWGGALRWLKSTADDNQIHRIARNAGGPTTAVLLVTRYLMAHFITQRCADDGFTRRATDRLGRGVTLAEIDSR